MRTPRLPRLLAACVFVASASAASVVAAGTQAAPAAASSLPSCNLKALAQHHGTVNITFWNSAAEANATVLTTLTNKFNSSQSKVHVTLVRQADYDDTWTKYVAGLSNGQLPDAVQLEDVRTQAAIDTQSFLPVQSCMNAAKYSTSDFLSRPLDYWKVKGVQWALPFAVSAPVLYYNQNAFTKAGLNPAQPPKTLTQLVADAEALKKSGSGIGLKLDPWDIEAWLGSANQLFVNNKNVRSARATKSVFNGSTAVAIFSQLRDMVASGAATTNPANGADQYDNLLGVGSGKYGMTIDTSAALGTVRQILASGQYSSVVGGVAPFPAYDSSSDGAIEPGGSGVYISKKSSALDQAASWTYLSYLLDTQSVATWAAGTGYIPVRKSSVQTSTIKQLWATTPEFKVAYDEINGGRSTAATNGSVIGPYSDVRTDVVNAWNSMYTGGASPTQAVRTAATNVNNTISNYDERLGVS